MTHIEDTVARHYTDMMAQRDQIMAGVAAVKAKRGGKLTPDDLAPFDQLHTGRDDATRDLIDRFAPSAGSHVLDVGSGLGGPARMLAARRSVHVTGIDLTVPFVELANALSQETGQQETVQFRQASALDLPFAPAHFDAAWHVHMAMNIADKARLYAEIFRVLKPGARFALYDPARGEAAVPIVFPVPWAASEASSFLLTATELRALLAKTGFEIVETHDATADCLAWFARGDAQRAGSRGAVQPGALQDPRFATMSANHRTNLESGAVAIFSAICRKPVESPRK